MSNTTTGDTLPSLAELREYSAKGNSLHQTLTKRGVPAEIAREIISSANLPLITEALFKKDNEQKSHN